MAVGRVEDTVVRNVRAHKMRRSTDLRTIAGNISLVEEDADVIAINGGAGNRNVLLYAPSAANEGREFQIHNVVGTNTLVVQIPGPSTLVTIAVGHMGFIRQVGGVWRGAVTVTDT